MAYDATWVYSIPGIWIATRIPMFQVEDIAAQSQSYVFVADGRARTSE